MQANGEASSKAQAKSTASVSRELATKSTSPGQKFHIDLTGPITPRTIGGGRYIISFLDSYTKYMDFKVIRKKSDAYQAYIEFKNRFSRQFNAEIQIIRTDNGTEFKNHYFEKHILEKGILHQFSAPYSHEQNGAIERPFRTLLNKVRAMIFLAKAPLRLWGEATQAAVYIYNRTPHSAILYKTPHELLHKNAPDINTIRVWGSAAFHKIAPTPKKLESRTKTCILIGYGSGQYKLFDPVTERAFWSRDVIIQENNFPYATNPPESSYDEYITFECENTPPDQALPETSQHQLGMNKSNESSINPSGDKIPGTDSELTQEHDSNPSGGRVSELVTTEPSPEIHTETVSTNPEIEETSEDELALHTTNSDDPTSYREAMNSPYKVEWQAAMKAELTELQKQNTWTLAELPHDKKALKGRWVFKLKRDQNNKIVKYKARWVIKGFLQRPGIDFEETFSNTARPETWRALFAIAAFLDLEIQQWDIKSAFPNAEIDKEIYCEQPTGFKIGEKHCRLNKALYGLKQSARQWYIHLAKLLAEQNFYPIPADQAVFQNPITKAIIVTHIDDLLIFSINLEKINKLKSKLAESLEITDLGDAKFFLGIEICRDRDKKSITLSQTKYTTDIIRKFEKGDLKPVTTPTQLGIRLEKSATQASAENISRYQSEIGSLIYLSTKTRPDITFAVGLAARFMSNPNETHFIALNRIWKYLNGTIQFSLTYQSEPKLLSYSDSDWGGDHVTRKSTTGYIFLFGNSSPISWASKGQKTVALSSCEAEYMALKETVKELLWLKSLFSQIQCLNSYEAKKLFTDSQSAIELAKNPEHHQKTKHIDIQYHFVRENVQNKNVDLIHVPTKLQLADFLTKGLSSEKFAMNLKQIGLREQKAA